MIGLDTNVLVRFIVGDDPVQTSLARDLIEGLSRARPGYLSLIVLAELHWVLRTRYAISRAQALQTFSDLLMLADVVVEQRELVIEAIGIAGRHRADLTDILISLQHELSGCDVTYTFDRNAAKLPRMRLLQN